MNKGGGSPNIPKEPNIGKTYQQGVDVYLRNAPALNQAEQNARQTYDPQAILHQQQAQAQFGPSQYNEQLAAMQQLDPNWVDVNKRQSDLIQQGQMAGSHLTPDQMQQTEQYVRAAQAARGNTFGGAPATAEAYALGDRGQQMLNQREMAAQSYLQGPTPSSIIANSVSPVTPDRSSAYVDPNAGWQGVNAGNQAYQSRVGALAANNSSGGNQWGSILSAVGSIVGGIAMSDRRLKTNIRKVGQAPSGVNIYDFSFKKNVPRFMPGASGVNPRTGFRPRFRGVLAQDVEGKIPGAVVTDPGSGIKAVNYPATGVKLQQLK